MFVRIVSRMCRLKGSRCLREFYGFTTKCLITNPLKIGFQSILDLGQGDYVYCFHLWSLYKDVYLNKNYT